MSYDIPENFTPPHISRDDNYDPTLYCPNCRGFNLHHTRVVVNERLKEDDTGLAIVIQGDGLGLSYGQDIPGRRNSLFVTFECENCDVISKLSIFQHKGCTFIGWVK